MDPKEYDENLAAEIDRVAKIMLGDSNDPTSYNYKRKNVRPNINWGRIILQCTLTLGGAAVIAHILTMLSVSSHLVCWITLALLGVVLFVRMKRILICVVRIYQRYAPEAIRNKCRFEPSCSAYMILSLEKYGSIKGLVKGICRIARCNVRNGGFDYP